MCKMSDLHNTTTAVSARAALRYFETASGFDLDIVPAFKEPPTPAGAASTTTPRGMGYALPMLITAATFAAFEPTPVSAGCNWNTALKPVVVQDGRERSNQRQSAESSVADHVVLELGKLENGWAGKGSAAPSRKIIEEIAAVMDLLPKNIAMPSIEVEEEDGMVSLRWIAVNGQRSFSLTCQGTGRVTGVVSTVDPPLSKPWSAAVSDDVKIALKLEDQIASGIFAG